MQIPSPVFMRGKYRFFPARFFSAGRPAVGSHFLSWSFCLAVAIPLLFFSPMVSTPGQAREYISVDKLAPASSAPGILPVPHKAEKKNVKRSAVSPDKKSVKQLPAAKPQPAGKQEPAVEQQAPEETAPQAAPKPVSGKFNGPTGSVHLFGTVEFKRPLESLPGWLDVLARNSQSPIFQAQKHFNKKTSWADLRGKLEGKSLAEQLRLVNTFWNSWPYREDKDNWGQPDYWEIPAEFLKKSGDCEDYAIVKYFTLKEMGVDPKSMRIVVLRDTIRNLAHAVLVVYSDGDAFVLDNLSNIVLSHRRISNYSPQYSVNEFGRWAHIKGKKAR